MQRLVVATLVAVATVGCNKGPNSVDGSVDGVSFGEALESTYQIAVEDAPDTYITALVTDYEGACTNYEYYVELLQYDSRNPYADPDHPPKYLAFKISLEGKNIVGDYEVLPSGEFYPGGPWSISAFYRYVPTGSSVFETVAAVGGTISITSYSEGQPLVAEFEVELETGDILTGKMEAPVCE